MVSDRLESYRAGALARRSGEPVTACPRDASTDAEVWEAGWWDEEAYDAQREVLAIRTRELSECRATISALCDVLRVT